MPRKKVILTAVLAVVFIVIMLAGVSAVWLQRFVEKKASDGTGRTVATSGLVIDWGWPVTRITAQDVTLSNVADGSTPDMLSIPKLMVKINFKGLLPNRILFQDIMLDQPKLVLEKNKAGEANWHFMNNPGSAAGLDAVTPEDRTDIPSIGRLRIQDGTLIYKDASKGTDITLQARTLESRNKGRKEGHLAINGEGKYQGHAFKLIMNGGTIFQLQDDSNPYPIDTTITVGKTEAQLKGSIDDPLKLKGLNLAMKIKGANAAELFDIVGMALPPTPPYDVTGQLDYTGKVWTFTKFKGRLGDSDLSGSLTWDTSRDRPLLTGDFVSQTLDFKDLGGFIGAAPTPETGDTVSAEQREKAAEREASRYIIPDTPLDISRLSAMDARVSFVGRKLISNNLPLDDFEMQVDLDDRLLTLKPLRFGTAKGDIVAYMKVNARQEPVQISGDFNFNKLQLKPIFESLSHKLGQPNFAEGAIGGKAQLAGTGKSLRQMLSTAKGDIGLGMEGGRLSNLIVELLGLDVAESVGFLLRGDEPVPVRCVIGDFGVDQGMMHVRHFVIDTSDSNIQGQGTINLKNEALDLTLHTTSKDSTLVSLNSPITLRGTLKDPSVGVNVVKVAARGAVATAAAFLFPPAVAVAFVEPGLGEDSQCNQLLKDMAKNTGAKAQVPKNK